MSDNPPTWNLETLLVHTGERQSAQEVVQQGMPISLPIYTTATFLHADADALDSSFAARLPEDTPAYIYSRYANPTVAGLERAMAAAEGGVGAVAFGSGMAALYAALLAAGLTPGATLIASHNLYGGPPGYLPSFSCPGACGWCSAIWLILPPPARALRKSGLR
jgi:O-acetylhomoserine/O-acetylserine sulfhydrylase-like pyridoxal-dependent enzyme